MIPRLTTRSGPADTNPTSDISVPRLRKFDELRISVRVKASPMTMP